MIDTSTNSETTTLARRRRRLSLDYHLQSHALLEEHGGHTSGLTKALSQCFATVRRQFLPHYFWSPPRWRVWVRQVLKARALPDFCIIGPTKSGTSDLAVTIMAHPNVLHPLVKEFSSSYPLAWKPYYPTLRAVQRHARRHGAALCPLVGPYLHCFDLPITLSALRPETKIVINLRNPVDVVFSMWKWTVLHREKELVDRVPFLATFPSYVKKAIELFPEAPLPLGTVLHFGIYATAVDTWLRAFGDANVRIFDIAEYFEDRNAYFARIERFLGLPHIILPQRLPVANTNPLEGLAPTPEASSMLKQFFEPYNRRLWNVIGTAYSW